MFAFSVCFVTLMQRTVCLNERRHAKYTACVQSYKDVIGDDMPGYSVYLAGEICGYLLAIATNFILIYAATKLNG